MNQFDLLIKNGTIYTAVETFDADIAVKDEKIIRTTNMEFDDTDPSTWTIKARGKKFTPPRKTSLSPHGQNWKSAVYSPDRIL